MPQRVQVHVAREVPHPAGPMRAYAGPMRRALLLLALAAACNRDSLEVAPGVEQQKFLGKWFEIARIPRAVERDCVGTTATYTARADGKLEFVHECTLTDGRYHGATALATVPDAKIPGKMEVDFGGHVGDYWVIDVAPDYRYAAVGHPSRDYLWILSRTSTMPPAELRVVLDGAKAKGFDTTRLEYTAPGPEPQGTPTPPVTYGCSMGSRTGGGGGGALLVAAIGALVSRRRRGR
ncbi:MAG: hypothetical protein EXQ77_06060 [Thermoleophilia bacterium]|nr:hypothetical protein [Thermoleophilia bacterium]